MKLNKLKIFLIIFWMLFSCNENRDQIHPIKDALTLRIKNGVAIINNDDNSKLKLSFVDSLISQNLFNFIESLYQNIPNDKRVSPNVSIYLDSNSNYYEFTGLILTTVKSGFSRYKINVDGIDANFQFITPKNNLRTTPTPSHSSNYFKIILEIHEEFFLITLKWYDSETLKFKYHQYQFKLNEHHEVLAFLKQSINKENDKNLIAEMIKDNFINNFKEPNMEKRVEPMSPNRQTIVSIEPNLYMYEIMEILSNIQIFDSNFTMVVPPNRRLN